MKTLRELQSEAHENARDKGFWDGVDIHAPHVIPEKIALIHSEASEMLESYREGAMVTTKLPGSLKPVGLPSELADVVIRCLDFAGAMGIDLQAEVELKMAYNSTRSHKHGKAC